MFHVEKLQTKREDTDFGRKKVYYVDGIRVVSDIDPECLSDEELRKTKKVAGEALDRINELREQNKPDRSNWPLYSVAAIAIILATVVPTGVIAPEFFFGLTIVALLTACYPLMKLMYTDRFTSIQIKIDEIFTACAFELAERDS